MKNPVLDKIKTFAVQELSNIYGFCSLADDDNIVMINTSDTKGNDIEIIIKLKKEKQPEFEQPAPHSLTQDGLDDMGEFEQQTEGGYKDDDGGNLPNGQ